MGLAALSMPAVAQDNETLTRLNKSCTQVQGDESLNACTRLINSGKYSGQGLAIQWLATFGKANALWSPYTAQFNMTGQPAITLPLHQTPAGLPVGVQLVAAYGREDILIRVASQLEQAAPWTDRHPPVHA